MATVAEIRQRLVEGGMTLASADQAARIMADMAPLPSPSGALWDTLNAKGYRLVSRPTSTIFRVLTNDKNTAIVMNKDGLNTLFVETAIESIP